MPGSLSGRGLTLVNALATRWGADLLDSGGKTVWSSSPRTALIRCLTAGAPQDAIAGVAPVELLLGRSESAVVMLAGFR